MSSKTIYGGQAVLEGVMIRGRLHVSVAVRKPDGDIAFKSWPLNSFYTGRLRQIPLIRGVTVLAETLVLGMKALAFSANVGMEAEGQELGKGAIASMITASLAFAIGVFFVIPVLASKLLEAPLGSDLAANIAEGVIRLTLFLGYLLLIGRMEEIRRVFMYHGAEHMTVHAQERGEPLDVKTVRRHSPAHPRCGTAFLLVVMVLSVVAFVFVGRDPFWWLIASRVVLVPAIAGISYEVIRMSGRHANNALVALITSPSLALQSLTTRQPEDDQIEVAIAAMRQAIDADEGCIPGPSTEAVSA